MAKIITLKKNSDFRRLYGRGKSFANPALVTYIFKNRAGNCRIGITASKKTGNAVTRNRARRVIRAAYTQLAPEISGNWDFVFVARARTHRMKSYEVGKVMRRQLTAAGVLQ